MKYTISFWILIGKGRQHTLYWIHNNWELDQTATDLASGGLISLSSLKDDHAFPKRVQTEKKPLARTIFQRPK